MPEEDPQDNSLPDGTYVMMIEAGADGQPDGAGYAVDLPNAKDVYQNNARFRLMHRNDSGAQIVTVSSINDGGPRVITFPLCNKVLAVANVNVEVDENTGLVTSYTPADRSDLVPQDNTGQEQARWDIEYAAHVEYGGNVFNSYSVKPTNNNQLLLQAITPNVTDETKLIITTAPQGGSWQKFFFIPFPPITPGLYNIRLQADPSRVFAAANKNDGANIRVVADEETSDNFRIWKILDWDTDNRCIIENLGAEKAIAMTDNARNNVVLYNKYRNPKQLFMTRQAGITTYRQPYVLDGEDWLTYIIVPVYGSGADRVLDPTDGAAYPGGKIQTNVQARLSNGNPKQQVFFTPAEAFASDLKVPSDVRHWCGYTGEDMVKQYGEGEVVVKPTWYGTGDYWQCRYSTRFRSAGSADSNARTSWTPWKSIEDDTMANNGWGVVTEPNCEASYGNGRWQADKGITLTLMPMVVDLYEIRYEIRAFTYAWNDDENIPAHGGTASMVCTLAQAARLVLSNLSITGEGVSIDYQSTFYRNGNTIHIWSDGLFDITLSNASHSGTASTSKLLGIPYNGETFTVKWTITTVDSITSNGSVPLQAYCQFDDETIGRVTPIYDKYQNGYLKVVKFDYPVSKTRLWLIIEDDNYAEESITRERVIEIQSDGIDTFNVPYPFNKPYSLRAYVLDNEGHPLMWYKQYSSVEAWTRLWNWGSGNQTNLLWCEALYNEGEPPRETVGTNPSNSFTMPAVGEWELGHVGHSWSQTRNITATSVDAYDPDFAARFAALSKARFAWYRSPRGEVMRVAITKVNETRKHDMINYTVDMRRIRE